MMHAFLERLVFPYISYDEWDKPLTPRAISSVFIVSRPKQGRGI